MVFFVLNSTSEQALWKTIFLQSHSAQANEKSNCSRLLSSTKPLWIFSRIYRGFRFLNRRSDGHGFFLKFGPLINVQFWRFLLFTRAIFKLLVYSIRSYLNVIKNQKVFYQKERWESLISKLETEQLQTWTVIHTEYISTHRNRTWTKRIMSHTGRKNGTTTNNSYLCFGIALSKRKLDFLWQLQRTFKTNLNIWFLN